MKRILGLVLVFGFGLVILTGCSASVPENADNKQAAQQEKMMNDQVNQVGLPDIKDWSEKKMAKEVYELRDNAKLVTYAYTQNLNGKFIYIGQCIGFGLPYSVQYTNPEKMVDGVDLGDSYGTMLVPQPEPNGLFMPDGLSATWLQYINPDTGKREVIYCEPNIVVTQSKLPKRLLETWSIPDNY